MAERGARGSAAAAAAAAAKSIEQPAEFARLTARSPDEGERRMAFTALAGLGRAHAEHEVWRVLAETLPSSVHPLALRLIESWQDRSCEPRLLEVLTRFDPASGFLARLFGGSAEPDEIERPRNGSLVRTAGLVMSYHLPQSISRETTGCCVGCSRPNAAQWMQKLAGCYLLRAEKARYVINPVKRAFFTRVVTPAAHPPW